MKAKLLVLAALASSALAVTLDARPGRNRPPPPDPELLAAEMIADYDADENGALNQEELQAAFKGTREKRRAENRMNRPLGGWKKVTDEEGPNLGRGRGPGQGRGPVPTERMAQHLVENFDADGNGELAAAELLTGLDFLQARRAGGRRPGPPPSESDSE